MSANQHLYDLNVQHALALLGYSNSVQNDMLGFLNDLEKDVVGKLASRLAVTQTKGFDPGPKSTERLNDTIAEIRTLTTNVYDKSHDYLKTEFTKFAQVEAEGANKRVNTAAKADVATKLPAPARLKAIVTERPIHGELLEPFVKRLGTGTADRVEQQIRLGMANGEGIDKIVARVTGTEGFDRSRNAARAMVRTSVNSISNQTQMETWKANSDVITGWQFLATLDSRTTVICGSLDGKTFPLGKGPMPPRHPNCRSTMTAVTKDLRLETKKYSATTRASMDGQVAATTDFETFLKGKPEAFQDATLQGKTRGDLWRAGKLDLGDFVRNYSEVIPLDELRALHPEAFGGTAAEEAAETAAETVKEAATAATAKTVDITALDDEARAYTLERGKATGNEHLVTYDANTGTILGRKQGDKSSVHFDKPLIDALDDKANALILHHNHPRSTSLSLPDLMVTQRPGAAGIWAHGHNGSSFYAERGQHKLKKSTVEAISVSIQGVLQKLINAGVVPLADAMLIHSHLAWLALNDVGQIVYRATLDGESKAAFDRNRALFGPILENLKK